MIHARIDWDSNSDIEVHMLCKCGYASYAQVDHDGGYVKCWRCRALYKMSTVIEMSEVDDE